ncbi:enoyl-CoA hydratase/isomerase family protein [Nocardioides humilatus]|uniref:Enoyl-CoA hydratase/isomerase family protein n=1 Tax=Nocardioides humilatus TaxID=2607660 RepID=A0A5B1L881_9ACTN|nr:enoyl-CoA hydratase/isomerase family protein [Nocardioides humilatus]KAA1416832.1 enoyl-CoA hydratase/isomerase family protein [Nocardioides humilatus]
MTPEELAHAGLDLAVDGVVATITLNRPEVRNAQVPRMWAGIARILRELGDDVRVVVVRGAGGTFSAGLDLSLLDPAKPEEDGNFIATLGLPDQAIIDQIGIYQEPFALLASPRFITIAVVEGHAIGAGFQLALSCDLRIVADDARFCMKEPALGLVPDLVGTKPLVEAVGYARALEICASARIVSGAEAGEIGIAQVVAPASELDGALAAMVDAVTAHAHGAVTATKQLLQDAPSRSLDDQRLAERTAQVGRFRALAGG